MATAPPSPAAAPQRLLLSGVDWRHYQKFLHLLQGRRAVRITYDRGDLELMTLSHEHESYGRFLGRLAVTLTEELGLLIKEGGSTTLRRRRKQRGLEPDNCYWVAREPLVRGKLHIDLRIDPAPDLAIEVDIAHGSLDRMAIYAALGIPEVWRFDGTKLSFHQLGADGHYALISYSLSFSQVTPADVASFLPLRQQMDENAVIAKFRIWVRQHHATGGSGQPTP
jgi:Uma2 family endonuclease